MPSIHFDINPIPCLVRKEYLFDLKSEFKKFEPASIFAVSSYPGHLLTFNVLVNDKFIYSYLPAHALVMRECESLHPEDITYFNCPSGELAIHSFAALQKQRCSVFNRNGSYRCTGKYLMTFDWYQDNELAHLIQQTDGRFLVWPSHKLVFDTDTISLPPFKKLHMEWKHENH